MQHSNPSSFLFTAAQCAIPRWLYHVSQGFKYWQMYTPRQKILTDVECGKTPTYETPLQYHNNLILAKEQHCLQRLFLYGFDHFGWWWKFKFSVSKYLIQKYVLLLILHTNKFCVEIKLHSLKIHSVSHHIPQSHFIGMQYLHDVYVGFVFNYV